MKLFKYPAVKTLTLLVVFSAIVVVSLCSGASRIPPWELFDSDSMGQAIIHLRLLRTLNAFVVGAALTVAGLIYQAILRNSLADPYILGISGGAGIGAVLAIVFGWGVVFYLAVPLSAFVLAMAALGCVWMIAGRDPLEFSNNALLAGVVVSSVCSSIIMFIISVIGLRELNSVSWWLLGNLQMVDLPLLLLGCVVVGGGTIMLFLFNQQIDILSLGGEKAWTLGVSNRKHALWLLMIASFLTATTVALAGIIGFVGLIVPHILRRIYGAEHRRLLPYGVIWGGGFLILCDSIARMVYPAQEIPIGVITAILGGPFFIYLLHRKRRGGVL